jgi:quinol monooxygenase YgiN
MIYVIASLRVKPGTREACIAAAQPAIAETRKEEGCLLYDMHASTTDADLLVFVEKWTDRAALSRHARTPHIAAWREASGPHTLERRIEVIAPENVETF